MVLPRQHSTFFQAQSDWTRSLLVPILRIWSFSLALTDCKKFRYELCRPLNRVRRLCMSRSWCRSTSLVFSSTSITRNIFLMISSGSTASMTYVRLKGVSLVLYLEVLRYDPSTIVRSSIQAPFDFIRRFLIPLAMVLFYILVWPLDWGCATEVKRQCLRFSSHHSLKGLPSNWVPLSLIRTLGVPNRVMMFVHTKFIICMPMTIVSWSIQKLWPKKFIFDLSRNSILKHCSYNPMK